MRLPPEQGRDGGHAKLFVIMVAIMFVMMGIIRLTETLFAVEYREIHPGMNRRR